MFGSSGPLKERSPSSRLQDWIPTIRTWKWWGSSAIGQSGTAAGKHFGPSAEFILPTGAALSPDAAWVSNDRTSQVSEEQRRKFPPICPEFIVEVMSPSDRLPAAKRKMQEWIRAGVELGWLIDSDEQSVYVYRAGHSAAEMLTRILKISGEGPVAGFELELTDIWAGL
jgi:Uma2 family endonuclease